MAGENNPSNTGHDVHPPIMEGKPGCSGAAGASGTQDCIPYGHSCTPDYLHPAQKCCPDVACYPVVLGLGGWCWVREVIRYLKYCKANVDFQ